MTFKPRLEGHRERGKIRQKVLLGATAPADGQLEDSRALGGHQELLCFQLAAVGLLAI